jgi:phospholipid transport system transporter-binding protein
MSAVHFKPGVELTFKSVVDVRAKLYQALMNEEISQFNLDLSEVIRCDSAGMALLIEAKKLCKKNNTIFDIIGMSSETRSLAEFCGVKHIFE